jgi:hypothetical protein
VSRIRHALGVLVVAVAACDRRDRPSDPKPTSPREVEPPPKPILVPTTTASVRATPEPLSPAEKKELAWLGPFLLDAPVVALSDSMSEALGHADRTTRITFDFERDAGRAGSAEAAAKSTGWQLRPERGDVGNAKDIYWKGETWAYFEAGLGGWATLNAGTRVDRTSILAFVGSLDAFASLRGFEAHAAFVVSAERHVDRGDDARGVRAWQTFSFAFDKRTDADTRRWLETNGFRVHGDDIAGPRHLNGRFVDYESAGPPRDDAGRYRVATITTRTD